MKKSTKKLITFLIFTLGIFPVFSVTVAESTEMVPVSAFSSSKDTSVTPPNILPSIISAYATPDTTSAILNGSVNPNGLDTEVWFESPVSSGKLGLQNINSGTAVVSLAPYTLTGLIPNTTYKFRVVASNANGTNNGSWVTFKTKANVIIVNNNSLPTLSLISPSFGTQGDNNLNVTLTGTGFMSDSTVTFSGTGITKNSTTINNTISITVNISIENNASTGDRNVFVTNTNASTSLNIDQTTNNIIPVSNNGNNNYVSNSLIFTINSASGGGGGGGGGGGYVARRPSVNTQNATNISKNSAVLNGSIDPNRRATTVWFEYGNSSNLSNYNQTNHISFGSGSSYSIHSQNLPNLNPNTTYYFRAVGSNSLGTTRGNILSFTTNRETVVVIDENIGGDIEPIYQDKESIIISEETLPDNNKITFLDDDYFRNRELGANVIFGFTNILPKTALGWLILLVLILIVIIIARELYEDYSKQKIRNRVNANHIENLPT